MTTQQLEHNPSYHPLLVVSHNDLLPFIQEQFSSGTWTIRSYLALLIVLLSGIVLFGWIDIVNGAISWGTLLKYMGLGTLLVFTLIIPLHEGLHGLAYKIAGAPKVSYGVNWRKFYFYAVADRFVIDRKAFYFIGLLPFLVVSVLSILLMFFVPVQFKWLLISVLFMHTGACAGDIALFSFYEQHKNYKELLTFDDVEKKLSFFYVREEPDENS
ncbi:MAG: DUF3267 domain-containing protein [Lewinellaceae bacterium]|nr:DUF3267 domain-containing protein [Saprospiraceae bacterium]MCB9336745.1 DUF3267 domain-containing protein [Lewinellaceae bacterium]